TQYARGVACPAISPPRGRRAADGWGPRRLIGAEFVVDASGRDSRAPEWLAELGYAPPRETVVAARHTYATSVFAPPLGHVADWKGLVLMGSAGRPDQGSLHPVEGGRWSVALATAGDRRPPADHESVLRAAGTLGHPLLREVLEDAKPLGPVYRFSGTDSRWRHYEKLRRWPDQFVVVGDALAALDPSHGPGMTLAVRGALVLEHILAAHGTAVGISYRLRRALAHQLAPAWRSATRSVPAADAPASLRTRLAGRYAARIAAAATGDEGAARVLLDLGAAPRTAALRLRGLRAALRRPGPAPHTPPSVTHGTGKRRRRPRVAPAAPAPAVLR
ncbi:hypothetical protein AB0M28_31290, partial [Streptomyces sp. NPDC051940]